MGIELFRRFSKVLFGNQINFFASIDVELI